MRTARQDPEHSIRFTKPSEAIVKDAVASDILVREGWAQFSEFFGQGALNALARFGVLMVKPDGLVAGTLTPIRSFLAMHGFRLAGATRVALDRAVIRLLWHRDWLEYSADRLAFSDYLYGAGPAVLLLIEDTCENEAPCSNKLARLKGPARIELRSPDDLRSVLGSRSRVVNFVHTPDSCLDMLRELAVLLDREERIAFLSGQSSDDLERYLAQIDREAGRHSFSLDESLERLGLQEALGPLIGGGAHLPFDVILQIVEEANPEHSSWDLVTIALHAIELDHSLVPEATIAAFEIACEAAGVEVPMEFELGARRSYADLQTLRSHISAPSLHDEPAGMFLARDPSGNGL